MVQERNVYFCNEITIQVFKEYGLNIGKLEFERFNANKITM
jgi:hypothetical protein